MATINQAVGMDLLLALPIELTGQVLTEWLSSKDVAKIDCAFCNAAKRKILHKFVFQSDCFTLRAPSNIVRSTAAGQFFMWITTRKIVVDTIYLKYESNFAPCKEYLSVCGQFVKHAHVSYLEASASAALSLIANYCPNLTHFCCENSVLVSTAPVMELLASCTKLDCVAFKSIGYDFDSKSLSTTRSSASVVSSVPVVLKARTVELLWCHEALSDVVIPAIQPEFVVKLRIDSPHSPFMLPNWHKYTNLRSLGFNYRKLPNDELLGVIFGQCPQIVNLDMSQTDCVGALSTALWSLKDLYSINLAGLDVRDSFLSDLSRHYKHSLTALHARAAFVTADGINDVLTHCTHLRTISYRVKEGINYALMKNITKLVCDFQTDDEIWQSMQQHCHSLEHLHLILGWGVKFVESPAMIAALRSLPALRQLTFFDAEGSMRSAQVLSVRAQLPNVSVVYDGDKAKWYDLFDCRYEQFAGFVLHVMCCADV